MCNQIPDQKLYVPFFFHAHFLLLREISTYNAESHWENWGAQAAAAYLQWAEVQCRRQMWIDWSRCSKEVQRYFQSQNLQCWTSSSVLWWWCLLLWCWCACCCGSNDLCKLCICLFNLCLSLQHEGQPETWKIKENKLCCQIQDPNHIYLCVYNMIQQIL